MEKSFKLVFVIVCMNALFCLFSCTTTKYYSYSLANEYNKAWVGKTKKQIIDNGGAPSRIVNTGEGNQIVIYEDVTVNSFSTNIGGFDIGRTDRNRSYVEFYINKNGQCYQVKTNHIGTYSRKEKVSFVEWLNATFR